MATPWTPDVELNDEIAKRLIESRFPELKPFNLRPFGAGWDNHAYLVNESLVFRIPHRKMGGDLMETECGVLSYLGTQSLPLQIPAPTHQAAADEAYPYRIAGYPLIEGVTADSVVWTTEERAANAERLGRFLGALHRVPIGLENPPLDTLRRAAIPYRLPIVLSRLQSPPDGFRPLLEELATTPLNAGPPVWVHGDLYARHLIIDSGKRVTGVIDWGDAHVGDPALDLAIAWMFLPPETHNVFKNSYGGVDQNTWRRARFRAMTAWVMLSDYAELNRDPSLARECRFMLQNLLRV